MAEETPVWMPFMDWYGIWPGYAGAYENGEGWLEDPPVGVQLAVQPARRSKVFFKRERPWERQSMHILTVLYEGGVYRMWYGTSQDAKEHYTCYAESQDGFNWTRPELGLFEYHGSKANNILFRTADFSLHSVFIDPAAPPEERYKGICPTSYFYIKGTLAERAPAGDRAHERLLELRKEMELKGYTTEQISKEVETHDVVVGGVSADGLRWRMLEKPLIDVGKTALDTHNIGAYDPETGEYVAYLRGGLERRRLVRRTGGKEFGNWPPTRFVFKCDPQDPVSDDVYNPCYCRYPTGSFHLMFPSMYHRLDSELDIQLATSRDGWDWSRPERKPIITRETEEGHYSQVYASPNLVPMDEDWETAKEWGLPYMGYFSRHDWGGPYASEGTSDGEFRWAIWKRGRLVALEASTEGKVTLVQRVCRGGEMLINFQTRKAGWIKVELVNPPPTTAAIVKPLLGYELDKADTLMGDELCKVVTWRGRSDLSELKGKNVSIRLHMSRAKIFAVAI